MANGKRRSQKKSNLPLSFNQILHLLLGWCFGSMEGRDLQFPFQSEEHRRQVWEDNREFLINKDANGDAELAQREPGTRPAAWWDYDSPEPRKIIKNAQFWEHREPPYMKKRGESPYSFGISKVMHPVEGWSAAGYPLAEYESEADYLQRLGLLLPGEAEALKNQRGDRDDR